ncbi:MAG TPA: hypothetical protein PKO06_10600 [Candidatus Ozemobacteraceae bacterium]|nr:hypothetical protein [Candidatus Ozemobacteraceae bacterium]
MKLQEVVLGIGIFAVLVLMVLSYIPIFGWPYGRMIAREKACYANMRVLLGAIEMYNMDHSDFLDEMNPLVMAKLHTDGYLKSPMTPCPGDQAPRIGHPFLQARLAVLAANLGASQVAFRPIPGGTYAGTGLASDGRIVCTMHGTVE